MHEVGCISGVQSKEGCGGVSSAWPWWLKVLKEGNDVVGQEH